MRRIRWAMALGSLLGALAGLGSLPGYGPCQAAAGRLRTYYVAAQELTWNYAPAGRNLEMGMPFDDTEALYALRADERIGAAYLKALYVEYTDESFTKRKERPAEEAYLGLLGPIFRAEVGDVIRVVFKNKASRPYSIHPHGVFYDKASEGAATNDGTAMGGMPMGGDAVAPGATYVYEWKVPERAGPGPEDPSSVVWPYHSHVKSVADANSGLVGAIVITRKGMARPDGTPKDVDNELVTLFDIFDENQSWYLEQNIDGLPDHGQKVHRDSEEFAESNLKHSINGYIFGNMPMPKMKLGQHVRWYLIALGTETDLHTPHWHGNTVLVSGHRVDTVGLLPATTVVADMTPDDPGIWMFHCHVNDHITAGMTGRYEVDPR
jgi:FtsP/CotA-like multicopper oxidase with cupredoxin domain